MDAMGADPLTDASQFAALRPRLEESLSFARVNGLTL